MPTRTTHEEGNSMRTGDKLKFYADLMRKQTDLVRQIESRANIVIGLSGATIAFAINKTGPGMHTWVYVSVFTAVVTIIFALMAVKPPKLFSRHGQASSVFYHTHIAELTQKKFIEEITQATTTINAAMTQYAIEIHNIVKYSLHYKKRFAHLAITVFTLGLFATVLAWLTW